MRILFLILAILCCINTYAAETRCGWLENPSPANVWLIDKDASWTITMQGMVFIDDKSNDLVFKAMNNENEFVITNRHYGFSCACLTVDTDKKTQQIKKVYKSKQLLLKTCLEDISITKDIPLRYK
mgnify:CR=1 FL=1